MPTRSRSNFHARRDQPLRSPARRRAVVHVWRPHLLPYQDRTKTAEDWNAAEAEAAANGGHLTAVNSAAENAFLTITFASGNFPLWLGGTDLVSGVQTHTYHWTTGEPFACTNWQPGEPNDFGGFEDYTTINWHFSQGFTSDHSTWNDTGLDGTNIGPYFGIVEVAAPEPT